MPIEWWSDVIRSIDSKIKLIAEAYGYGSITFEATIAKGQVRDLVFKDKVRVRQRVPVDSLFKETQKGDLTTKPKP